MDEYEEQLAEARAARDRNYRAELGRVREANGELQAKIDKLRDLKAAVENARNEANRIGTQAARALMYRQGECPMYWAGGRYDDYRENFSGNGEIQAKGRELAESLANLRSQIDRDINQYESQITPEWSVWTKYYLWF